MTVWEFHCTERHVVAGFVFVITGKGRHSCQPKTNSKQKIHKHITMVKTLYIYEDNIDNAVSLKGDDVLPTPPPPPSLDQTPFYIAFVR